jgi:pyruvate formate lyase activating enzyme
MSEEFYRKVCGAELDHVLDSIKLYHEMGIWTELTTLVIPHRNDSPDELRQIARFIASVDKSIPWHVTQFHPTYRLTDEPRTPVETLRMAREIGLEEGLLYVYEGNVPGEGGENTYCPSCSKLLIERFGYTISGYNISYGRCSNCREKIHGVGM